ncbi:LytTR family DNA-binding domain-containing protein [Paraglaciecola sp. MB-3u-78]|uniref:LytR/AlgR family response regulator transcription factor n=1 Tax=Paraglaciecola sp. MB-3u-78 TaxID=2058332 RepID=UPI000C34518D|nr:LytTR family DNA-binding domain-containing protein [Paraglaciecola sp. MB-3u-78]PKG93044.1 DNA-binding response regulator [Paraglaciecola sp. MB-3u-78]
MSRQLTAIIVDDERLAREGLMLRLNDDPRFDVVAQCPSAQHALNAIEQFQPDIAFVDIEMSGLSGLELAELLSQNTTPVPKIVFVTAFREFALNAFEFQAFDYLLKPFSDDRLASCLSKLTDSFFDSDVVLQHHKLDELLSRKTGNSIDGFIRNLEVTSGGSMSELQRSVSMKSGSEWIRVRLDDISWIEAAGDYMCVHTLDGTHIIRKTLKQFEQELDPNLFPRVNRSAMINMSKLKRLTPNSNGEYEAQLTSGDSVKVSRKYKFKLEELRTKGGSEA